MGDWFVLLNPSLTLDLLDVRVADLKAHNPEKIATELEKLLKIREKAVQMIDKGTPWRVSDLKKIGCNGREIGKILDKLLLLAANEKIENIHSVLLEYAVNIKSAGD